MRRLYAGALATIGMLLALGAGTALAEGRTGVILGGSLSQVDYHAEAAAARPAAGGATIIGGNIQIKSDRGLDKGVAGVCDPDPRFAPAHPRPDDQKGCSWATPGGPGEDFISFGRTIQNNIAEESGELPNDTDTSPNGAFTPVSTPTRERFNGRGGLDRNGALFIENRPVLDDEDLNVRIMGSAISSYLSPQGDADNRWRRLCGQGSIEAFDKHLPIAAPFANDAGKTRAFVIQIWDADFKDPSDRDGGNQDYFIIDVYKVGTTFDVNSCVAKQQNDNPCVANCGGGGGGNNPGCVVNCTTSNPTPVAAVAPARAVQGVRAVARGTARIAGARTCPVRSFSVRVTGRQIRRVTFTVDGRRVATVTRADRLGRWQARIDPRRLRTGTHRVRGVVLFNRGAGPARTLRMNFRTCAAARQVAPNFTG